MGGMYSSPTLTTAQCTPQTIETSASSARAVDREWTTGSTPGAASGGSACAAAAADETTGAGRIGGMGPSCPRRRLPALPGRPVDGQRLRPLEGGGHGDEPALGRRPVHALHDLDEMERHRAARALGPPVADRIREIHEADTPSVVGMRGRRERMLLRHLLPQEPLVAP